MRSPRYSPADAPTLYFIGVTTAESSIMRIFPHWADYLELGDARIVGVDFPLDARPPAYREIVAFIKDDPLSRGALVTTHKLDLLQASREVFDELDDYADLLGEVSCISKRGERLIGRAVDAETGRMAMEAFLPGGFWRSTGAEALFLGAGGATLALTTSLLPVTPGERPGRITVTDVDEGRLRHMRTVHGRVDHEADVRYVHVGGATDNDALVGALPPRSVVVNGTGMGKDRPGSPVTDDAPFPENGYAWDYNYRGAFTFLKQAERSGRSVTTVDGWVYFILGWTRVIAEVFDVEIPTGGPAFEDLSRLAARYRVG